MMQVDLDLIWDYLCLKQPLKKSDIGILFGSPDLKTAEHGAALYRQGYFKKIVCSGGLGRGTEGVWKESEAVKYKRVLVENGVPDDDVFLEDQSTNSGENILYTKAFLEKNDWGKKSLILVQKPYMKRRLFAAFRKRWPEKEDFTVTSIDMDFNTYVANTHNMSKEEIINYMVGDLCRTWVYAEQGFQIPQIVPDDVMAAYERMVAAGYDKYVV